MNEDFRYPVADVERATVTVLSGTPLLCTLDRPSLEAIGREVLRGTARRLSEEHRVQTTLPAIHGALLESLKDTTLFCVLIGPKLCVLADHIARDIQLRRPDDGAKGASP